MNTNKMYETTVEIKDLSNGTTYTKSSLLKEEGDSKTTNVEVGISIAEDASYLLCKVFNI